MAQFPGFVDPRLAGNQGTKGYPVHSVRGIESASPGVFDDHFLAASRGPGSVITRSGVVSSTRVGRVIFENGGHTCRRGRGFSMEHVVAVCIRRCWRPANVSSRLGLPAMLEHLQRVSRFYLASPSEGERFRKTARNGAWGSGKIVGDEGRIVKSNRLCWELHARGIRWLNGLNWLVCSRRFLCGCRGWFSRPEDWSDVVWGGLGRGVGFSSF